MAIFPRTFDYAPPVQRATQPVDRVTLRSVTVRWKIGIVLFIAAAVAINAVMGAALFQLFGVFTLTLYGLVVITRKILQIILARMSNHRTRLIVRKPIIDSLVMQYPHLEEAAYRILRRAMHFDDFKAAVLRLLSDTYDKLVLEGEEENTPTGLTPTFFNWEWVNLKWAQIMRESFGEGADMPYVGVVIPTYKTSKLELQRLIESLEDQTYPNIWVCIVLNENNQELKDFTARIVRKYGGKRYIRFVEPRRGKRHAMRMGFKDFLMNDSVVEYVFNVDSDSKLHPDAIANAVRLFQSDACIGCLTGNIQVSNADVNLLTKLTYHRFYFAFNVERAAQNLWYGVTCMSGAFMAVRTDLLRYILEPWSKQRFLGKHCSYGDDRHIATLTLQHGLKAAYCPDSLSYTDVPSEMPVWKLQQTRWARSAWRETILTLPWLHRLPLWIVFEVAYLAIFPFILWGILIALAYRTLAYGAEALIPYLVVVLALNLIFNGLYGMVSKHDFSFLMSPLYLFYQFAYLQPLRLWALISLNVTKWGTK